MDAEQTRIEADLKGVLEGEVFCNPLYTQMYASDASLYEIPPLAVVRPLHEEDVVQCVKYASENSLPIFPRGGGTGHILNKSLIIRLSLYLNYLCLSITFRDVTLLNGLIAHCAMREIPRFCMIA